MMIMKIIRTGKEPAQMRTAKTVIILSRQRMIRQIHHRRQQFPDTPYDTTPQESVTVYKLDSQGSKTAVNITSSDSLKIADIIDGKKYSQDVETNGYAAVLKYKGNEYYYDSKSKMLVVSGKGARLSESENAELKKIIKLD